MGLRIAFDLDGVLADMEGELAHQAELLFGEDAMRALREEAAAAAQRSQSAGVSVNAPASGVPLRASPPVVDVLPASRLNLTPRQQRRLWRHVESIDRFWESLKEIEPGLIERLAAMATERRWEVIFLTKRPASAGATAQVQTQRWLEAKGFRLPSVYVVQGSRGRIAAALDLDFVIDDRPENCLDIVADSKARAILVWRDDPKLQPAVAHRLGVGVVKSMAECLEVLLRVEAVMQERPRVVDRVMRLLKLKEPANA